MNYELRIKKPKNAGYTIIETMISVSLFIILVMTGMGALLNANLLHGKSRDMRSIMDNLSFIMEDMSRNLRTGYNYHCINDGDPAPITPLSCESGGGGISFMASDGSQWVYYLGTNPSDLNKLSIFKSVAGGVAIPLNPDEVDIYAASGFSVFGAEPPANPLSPTERQPFVTIKLVGEINYKGVITPFSLQTSVSQRNIDI